MTTPEQKIYCSDISMQAGEMLFGTATPTKVYLLLEYNGAWGEKALEESDLVDAVKARLKEAAKSIPAAKALLIRSRRSQRQPGVRFFVAVAAENNPALYAFHLQDYNGLLSLDIDAILEGASQYQAQRRAEPLILVCTNGRRDACCARKGVPTFDALSQAAANHGEMLVWQSSHVGGHRYAANMICLPHGLLYGRVDPEVAATILEAYQSNQVYPPNLRGRTCYSEAAQVADYFLRQQSGELAMEAFQLLDERQAESGEWEVRFTHKASGQVHELRFASRKAEVQVFAGCALDKSSPAIEHRLLAYQVLEAEG